MDQDGLALDAAFAEPHLLFEIRIGYREHRSFPASLATAPAGLEIAGHHVKQGQVPVRDRGVDAVALQAFIDRESFIEPVHLAEQERLVVDRQHVSRSQRDGAIEPW